MSSFLNKLSPETLMLVFDMHCIEDHWQVVVVAMVAVVVAVVVVVAAALVLLRW